MSHRIHKELVAAVGKVLAASPNLPGWKSAWDRLEKAHKAALSLPPDPPGECCRRTRQACAQAAVDAVANGVIVASAGEVGNYVLGTPLPGAKEGGR